MNRITARFVNLAARQPAHDPAAQRLAPGQDSWSARVEQAFDAGQPVADVLRTAPRGAWGTLALLAAALASAVALGMLGSVELTIHGPAVLAVAQARARSATDGIESTDEWRVFIPANERTRVRPGAAAHVEVQELSAQGHAAMPGRVVALSEGTVDAAQWQSAMGTLAMPASGLVVATVAVERAARADRLRDPLRVGDRAEVRITVGERTFFDLLRARAARETP